MGEATADIMGTREPAPLPPAEPEPLVMQYPESEWTPAPTLHYAVLEEAPHSYARQLRRDTIKVIDHVLETGSCLDNDTRMQLLDRGNYLFDTMERLVSSGMTEQALEQSVEQSAELDEFLDQRDALINDLLQNLRKHYGSISREART